MSSGTFFFFETMSKLYVVLALIFCMPIYQFGQGKLIMNDEIISAYKDITELKMVAGLHKVNHIKLTDPKNAMAHYIENYIDFFTLFIQEDAKLYKSLLKNRDYRLKKIKESDTNSPYYRFCQAEIILQWATIKLKFDDKISAAKDVYQAYKLLEENKAAFPGFMENNKSLSIIHALAESVPSWVRKLMGIKGSVALGTKEISTLVAKANAENSIFKNEIVAIYSYILFYSNNKKEEAFRLYDTYKLDHKKNILVAFLKSTMAHKTGRNDLAIKILDERPKGNEYLPFYYLDFVYGKYKLYKLEKDASIHILKFLNHFQGQHYIKEAWQKLAWCQLVIYDDVALYKKYMRNCVEKGKALIDEDIQAQKEAKNTTLPNTILLKARILYDGGYYTKAQNLLILHSKEFVYKVNDGEYYYRLGRVTDALQNYKDALEYYDLTLVKGDPDQYYGCSAALNAALIYEQQKKYVKARQYFEKCLNLEPSGYSTSLHQKANSGLDRIKGK